MYDCTNVRDAGRSELKSGRIRATSPELVLPWPKLAQLGSNPLGVFGSIDLVQDQALLPRQNVGETHCWRQEEIKLPERQHNERKERTWSEK